MGRCRDARRVHLQRQQPRSAAAPFPPLPCLQRDSLRSIVMVGDGATDAEARAPGAADAFVCYCGVVLREGAARRADWCIKDIHTLLAVLRGGEP